MDSKDIKALLSEEKKSLESKLPLSAGDYELKPLVYDEESSLRLGLKLGENFEPIFHLYPHRTRTAILSKGAMPSGCIGALANLAWNSRVKKVRQHLERIGYTIMESDSPSYKITTRRYTKEKL